VQPLEESGDVLGLKQRQITGGNDHPSFVGPVQDGRQRCQWPFTWHSISDGGNAKDRPGGAANGDYRIDSGHAKGTDHALPEQAFPGRCDCLVGAEPSAGAATKDGADNWRLAGQARRWLRAQDSSPV
jgi:hypothetical protein